MATKIAAVPEKLLECEVKRRRVRAGGGYESFWKMKTVADAVMDGDTEFRCPHCHHEVKLHRRAVGTGFASHGTHKLKGEAERCHQAVAAAANAPAEEALAVA